MIRALVVEQRRVATRALVALASTIVVFGGGLIFTPDFGVTTLLERIVFAIRCDLFVFAWVLATVGAVANMRFGSAVDIDGSAGTTPSERITRARAVLQNTLEQAVLAAPAHLALATLLPTRQLIAIPLAVGLFGVGRIFFWRGFADGAGARAFGFGLTFYPTAAAYLAAAIIIVSHA